MKIYNWDMITKNVDKAYKEYYTANKIYEVRNGKIILDSEYDSQNKAFTLDEFLSGFGGDWIISRVNIKGIWYKKELEE